MYESEAIALASELVKELDDRKPRLQKLWRYYTGDHDLPRGPKKMQEKYRELLQKSRGNLMGLLANAVAERLEVRGIRLSNGSDADAQFAWKIWQRNHLDSLQNPFHVAAIVLGEASQIAWPDGKGSARITCESPMQVLTRFRDGDLWDREASVKAWTRSDERRNVTLYTPEAVWRWTTRDKAIDIGDVSKLNLEPRVDPLTGSHVIEHDLGVDPVVPFRPRLRLVDGCSPGEFEEFIDDQDRINETIFSRLLAAWFASYRQKWATGLDVPEDPETGQAVEPFDAAVDRLLWSSDENTKFGDFGVTDLDNYIKSEKQDIEKYIAGPSQTPSYYLLGDLVNIPADALKLADSGLVSKTNNRQTMLDESHEEVASIALRAAGRPDLADDVGKEMIWKSTEFRTDGQLVDALTKMATLGVPPEALWEKWGASPQEIDRWKQMRAQEQDRMLFGAAPPSPTGAPQSPAAA